MILTTIIITKSPVPEKQLFYLEGDYERKVTQK